MDATDEVYQILRDAKVLARRYYHLTGKPLGVTGEVAEYEAARILNLELELARQAGYDATEIRDGLTVRIQIKGRYFSNPRMGNGRVGSIDLKQCFDTVLLVLLDAEYNAFQIYEAARPAVEALLTKPGSKARNERGSVGISQFKAISTLRWERVPAGFNSTNLLAPVPAPPDELKIHLREPANKLGSGKLTERGVEVCYRLFDAGKSRNAVRTEMEISFGAATHRFEAWKKAGGLDRKKQPLD
ncbi:hypothetical protein [Pseudomonas sp. BF-R-01]|uniref:hypothetical protein n=1 Tax=Pseudomonas sp. BF-R-01 TaxID=2832365 RepID=UPI001CBE26A5|nr:hypothetical protein [Pseudomonas sp. BF-R-01]